MNLPQRADGGSKNIYENLSRVTDRPALESLGERINDGVMEFWSNGS
jgi:hypothetical protein